MRIILFGNGGLCAPLPPAFVKPCMLTEKKKSHAITMKLQPPAFLGDHACNKKQSSYHHYVCTRGRLCGYSLLEMGGALLRPSMLAGKKHVITRFAIGEGCADHFVCKWGGCAPPTPLFFLAAIQAYRKKSCHHHGCSRVKLCGSFCLQTGGAPVFFRPSMLTAKRYVITMFAE